MKDIRYFFIWLIVSLGIGFISDHFFSKSPYYPDVFNYMSILVRGAIIGIPIFLLIFAIEFLIINRRSKK